jgi:hypothetical protein
MLSKDVVYYISDKVLKDLTLDIFYLISQAESSGISKIDVLREYRANLGVNASSSKFRYQVDEAIATLIGTTFIDFYPEGTSYKYFITEQGELAVDLMGELIKNKPELLKTSKIVAAVITKMEGNK